MSEKIGGAYIEIQAKMGSLEADLRKLEARLKQTDNTASNFGGTFRNVAAMLAGGTIVKGILGISKAASEASSKMEQNRIAFATMLGDAGKATTLLKQMQEFAETTPFEFSEIAQAGKQLLAFGVTAEQMIPTMRRLGDISAGLNIPLRELSDIYGKIKTSNRIMGDDLRQLGGRGIPIVAELAKQYGVTESAIYKMAEKGKFSFNDMARVVTNLTKEGGKFGGLMAAQSGSLAGMQSNFNDQLAKTAVLLGNNIAAVEKQNLTIQTALVGKFNEWLSKQKETVESTAHWVTNNEKAAAWISDSQAKLEKIKVLEKDKADMANLYQLYLKGTIPLNQKQIDKLQTILGMHRSLDVIQKGAAKEAEIVDNKKKVASEDEIKAYNEKIKKAKELADAINKDYIGALGNVDQKLDLEKKKFSDQADEVIKNYEKRLISEESYLKQIDQLQAEYDAVERKRFDEKLKDFQGKYNQYTGVAKDLSGQLSSVISMAASNQTTNIDNTLKKKLDALDAEYEANVEAVNNSILTEEEKAAKLKALDEQKEREREALENAAEKKKRKIQREAAKKQKLISMFETIISTPDAAMKSYLALAGIPIVGPALGMAAAAAATALGIAKLKLIQETPLPALATGGIVPAVPGGTPVRVSEAGSAEAVIPLNSQFGLDMLSQALAKAGGNSGGITHITLNIDGDKLYENIYQASRSGRVKIASGAMVA